MLSCRLVLLRQRGENKEKHIIITMRITATVIILIICHGNCSMFLIDYVLVVVAVDHPLDHDVAVNRQQHKLLIATYC